MTQITNPEFESKHERGPGGKFAKMDREETTVDGVGAGSHVDTNEAHQYANYVGTRFLIDPKEVEEQFMMSFDSEDDAKRAAYAEYLEHDGDVDSLAVPKGAKSAAIEKFARRYEANGYTGVDSTIEKGDYFDIRSLADDAEDDLATVYDATADDDDRMDAFINLKEYARVISDTGSQDLGGDDWDDIPSTLRNMGDHYGVTFVRDSYMDEEYMRDRFTDLGYINSEAMNNPLYNHIDWNGVLEEHKQNNCTEVTIGGTKYQWEN